MYKDTVTVFNHYRSALGDIWFPTILRGVNLNIDRASIVERYGADSKDNALLNIRYFQKGAEIYIDDKRYLLPKEWERLPNDELSGSITFESGNNFTFFIQGEWGDGITPINDDEYTTGFYEYMNAKFDNVFAVSSVAQYSVIPHFELLAK